MTRREKKSLHRIGFSLVFLIILLTPLRMSADPPGAFGIFVGISTYKNGESLAYCADDAARLGRFFAALEGPLHIPAERSIVLMDTAATKEAIRNAFATMRSRMSPDDLFLFYYSGHGGGEDEPDAPPRDEVDGHDETLSPWDANGTHKGEISDDTLRQWLDEFPNRDRILILDACFSGGFVRDLARDGTLVLAATQEDQSSMVAYAHRISGALTHSILTGLSGEADEDGDLRVSDRELIRHLSSLLPRYCATCGRRNPPGRSRCYYDKERLGGDASHLAQGGRISTRFLSILRAPYRPPACSGADELRSCGRKPSECRCEVKGECGGAECMTIGRKVTDGCGSEGERDACRRNPALCPCPEYGNCRMTGCVSPDEPVCTKETDRAQCEHDAENCPCGHFGDCEMGSCARPGRRQR
ncbi:MAG: caspase family protein [Candidatus Hydrogenedentota bacterium]